jgi:lipopolysaccharide biosynthesis regulator YciM
MREDDSDGPYWAECDMCGVQTAKGDFRDNVAPWWNMRFDNPDALEALKAALAETHNERAEAQAEIARLTAALEQCRDKFAEYAALHLAKGTRDGIIKAQANADMANLVCGAALKGNQP